MAGLAEADNRNSVVSVCVCATKKKLIENEVLVVCTSISLLSLVNKFYKFWHGERDTLESLFAQW